jgi:hypothetical protein
VTVEDKVGDSEKLLAAVLSVAKSVGEDSQKF